MGAEVDHVFVCCDVGAPEAAALVAAGLTEGAPNTHPGQGTACRRFFFRNAYIELFWVHDPLEAQSDRARPTRLWDRWRQRGAAASPFGIILRPGADDPTPVPPFPTWSYRPSYMPAGAAIEIAQGTALGEPELFYLGLARGRGSAGHGGPPFDLTGVDVWTRASRSPAAAALEAAGLVRFHVGEDHLMELTFDHAALGVSLDLRPTLPLTLRW